MAVSPGGGEAGAQKRPRPRLGPQVVEAGLEMETKEGGKENEAGGRRNPI